MTPRRIARTLPSVRRRIHQPVDRFHRLPRADDCAFLPAAPERDLVAGLMETALRRGEKFGVGAEFRLRLVGPGEAEMLHLVPADRDALLDELAEALVQPLALLARDVQALLDR